MDCVYVGDLISKKFAYGAGGDFKVDALPESIKQRFSLDFDELVQEMDSLDEEVENARMFIKLGEAG